MQSNTVPPPAAFIVGVPRSGTTLLRMMLDSHPEMGIPPETHFYFEVIKRNTAKPLTRADFYELLGNFFTWPDFGIKKTDFAAALATVEPFSVAEGLRAFYAVYAGRFGKSRWGEKTPDYGDVMLEIEALLPEAHFIHIIRDGRDVALSRRHLWFGPGESIVDQAEDWVRWIMRARQAGRTCAHYLEVHYENLLERPAEVLQEVCSFLQLPFREEMLAYHETAGERLKALQGWPELKLTGEQLQSILQTTTKPPQLDRAERWKREMSWDEVSLFEEIAGPVLREVGREVGGNALRQLHMPLAHGCKVNHSPSVTALLFTDGISEEAFQWFTRLRTQADEFVIWIDSQKATPETEERARQLATRIDYFAPNGVVDPFLAQAVAACKTDWILRLDSDEELSSEWDKCNWRELLQRGYTNFALPRRWITSAGRYIAAAPWWPDYQVRLFRNMPGATKFPTGVHGVIEMEGRQAHCHSLALHHHVLRTLSRAAREEKVRFYETLSGPDLRHYYLFEDYAVPQAAIPSAELLDPETELLRMDLLYAEQAGAVSLEIRQVPEQAEAAQLFWAQVQVTNDTNRALSSLPPFPVHLSYHWLERNSGAVEVFEGQRTALLPVLRARETAIFSMVVSTPSAPGDYLLQVTLVQEAVRWFEHVNPSTVRSCEVRIGRPIQAANATFGRNGPALP